MAAATRAAAQSAPVGPITFEEQSPLQRVSYTFRTEGADLVAPGRIEADLWLGYSNIFEHDSSGTHRLFLDMGSLLSSTTLRYGLARDWEVGTSLTFATTGGGFLDSFLIQYHRFLGLGDSERGAYPRNAYHGWLENGAGHVLLSEPSHELALDNVRVFAKWRAYRSADGGGVLSLKAVGEVPGDQNTVGHKRANLALMALGRRSWTRYQVFGMLGAATVRVGPELRPIVRPWAWYVMAGGARSLAPWISAVGELTVASPRMRGFHAAMVDGAPINLVLGFAGRARDQWRWNFGLQEDTPPTRPSVDFTLCLGLSRTW